MKNLLVKAHQCLGSTDQPILESRGLLMVKNLLGGGLVCT